MKKDIEKYLIKRISNIHIEKTEELRNKFNNLQEEELSYLINYIIENKSKLKLKCKYDPKEIFDIITAYPQVPTTILERIFDLSKCEYYKNKNELNERMSDLHEKATKLKRIIILGNDCNEILKMIKDFENLEI